MKLSPTQLDVLQKLDQHGILERKAGGFWIWPNCPQGGLFKSYEWNCGVQTLYALDKRKLIAFTKLSKRGDYYVEVALTAVGQEVARSQEIVTT